MTERGDLVLDIFLGSGTTLIAAVRSLVDEVRLTEWAEHVEALFTPKGVARLS